MSPNFSPNVAEIPNLGTNSPKLGCLRTTDFSDHTFWTGCEVHAKRCKSEMSGSGVPEMITSI